MLFITAALDPRVFSFFTVVFYQLLARRAGDPRKDRPQNSPYKASMEL